MKNNEITMDENTNTELIQVVQLPVIVEQLHTIKSQIEEASAKALAMEVSEDTLKSVKKTRADLRRAYQDLESKRKQVQEVVMAPYNDFLKVYNECVTDIFAPCDAKLKQKIDAVEDGLRAQKRSNVESYFNEYAQSIGIDFVHLSDAGIVVTRTASLKSLKKSAKDFLDSVNQGLQFISASSDVGDEDEVLFEFKRNGYDAMRAITTIKERKEAMEAERQRRIAMEAERQRKAEEEARKRRILEEERVRQEQEQAEQESFVPVDAENEFSSQQAAIEHTLNESEELDVLSEVDVEETLAPDEQEAQTEAEYELTFTVRGKLSALKDLKKFLVNGPYEIIE